MDAFSVVRFVVNAISRAVTSPSVLTASNISRLARLYMVVQLFSFVPWYLKTSKVPN